MMKRLRQQFQRQKDLDAVQAILDRFEADEKMTTPRLIVALADLIQRARDGKDRFGE